VGDEIIVEIKIKTNLPWQPPMNQIFFSSFRTPSSRTMTLMQHNDPRSLYAQTAVRLEYYASDKYSESYELAGFVKDGSITFLSPFLLTC